MSGGSFDYAYSRVAEFAEKLGRRLDNFDQVNSFGETPDNFEPEVLAKLRKIEIEAQRLSTLMRAVEWLYSGDYGEKTFLEQVQEADAEGPDGWTPCSEGLPDIPEGKLSSDGVLAGCWMTDDWLRDDHPQKRRFIFGACRVFRETDLGEFPSGRQWHTFGPAHSQITHWRRVQAPKDGPREGGDA